jgi:hypothetical protein
VNPKSSREIYAKIEHYGSPIFFEENKKALLPVIKYSQQQLL